MNRRTRCPLAWAVLAIVAGCWMAGGPAPAQPAGNAQGRQDLRPNFIVFLMDDVGYNDLGVFGAQGLKTPNFDRIAAQGVVLTDFYVHPVCGVTRAALMTGCYAMRVAEHHNRKFGHPVLHNNEVTIAEVLKEAGYATALVGKWHLAGDYNPKGPPPFDPNKLPNNQGFDYWFGTPTHNGNHRRIEQGRFRAWLMCNGQLIDDEVNQADMDQLTSRYTQQAIDWITRHKDQPFFLYLAHNMAHVTLGASEKFRGSSDRGLYGDVIQELDWSAGQIIQTLRRLGLAERTLVFITSDNGPWVERHLAGEATNAILDEKYGSMKPWQYNAAYRKELMTNPAFAQATRDDHFGRAIPLRGSKIQTWEGGVRVPALAWWPGRLPAGKTCRQPAAIFDLMPTLARLAGARLPQDRVIDGRDILPLLTDPDHAPSPHQALYYYAFTYLHAVRSGKWKLVRPRPEPVPWASWYGRFTEPIARPQLFDLMADPQEQHDLADQHPQVVQRLMGYIEQARRDIGDYDRIGENQRFFDDPVRYPPRSESARWLKR